MTHEVEYPTTPLLICFRVQFIDTASPIAVAVASGLGIRPLVVTHVYNLECNSRDRQLDLVVITGVIYSFSNLCPHKLSDILGSATLFPWNAKVF